MHGKPPRTATDPPRQKFRRIAAGPSTDGIVPDDGDLDEGRTGGDG